MKDENITLAEDWLEERFVKGQKDHIIEASLTYQLKNCLKYGLVDQREILKNGTHMIQVQLLPYQKQQIILELKKTYFLIMAKSPIY